MLRFIFFLTLCVLGVPKTTLAEELVLLSEDEIGLHFDDKKDFDTYKTALQGDPKRKKRWQSALICLLTGPVGGHRIFLGTHPKIPVLYAITLGGFGVGVLIDLGHILFKKDLESFQNNPDFFMWQNALRN